MSQKRRRICLVTYDLVGPIRNGGIGTATTALAEALADDGQDVTILYMGRSHAERVPVSECAEQYAAKNIRLVPLPPGRKFNTHCWGVLQSYDAYQWLAEQHFDIINFHEWRGPGFHCICAKQLGLAFENVILSVTAHSPLLWHQINNCELVESAYDLGLDYMERRSVAGADYLFSPSQYLLDWMRDHDYQLPAKPIVIQNILRTKEPSVVGAGVVSAVKEIVFFGRPEPRKGVTVFCDAVERVLRKGVRDFRVTFLGKLEPGPELSFLQERVAKWSVPTEILTEMDSEQAQDYLTGPGRMAVIASLVENSPYTVLECLGKGVPFIASRVGGIPELIDRAYHEETLFTPEPPALAKLLIERLEHGHRSVPCAIAPEDTRKAWLEWFRTVPLAKGETAMQRLAARADQPLVSVCMVHHNRPEFLEQALTSLRAQDYRNFEVVLVDDGSTAPAAVAKLDELEPEFAQRGWRIVRQENRYLGAARNTAARNARGEYLLFMDDDNYAKPHEITTFVAAAEYSGADILTAHMDCFFVRTAPIPGETATEQWGTIGASIALGVFQNTFGDANALVRKRVFEAVGGFTEVFGVGHEDWEFFAKAALKGYRLEVVPEALFYYRVLADSMLRQTSMNRNLLRNIRPYLAEMPQWAQQVILLALGQYVLLEQSAKGQRTEAPARAVADHEVLLLKDRVYNALLPYPRVLGVLRRSVHMAIKVAVSARKGR